MTTKMEVIELKLQEFIQIGKTYVDGSIFPNDVDIADLVFYIHMLFGNDLSTNWNAYKNILYMKSIKLDENSELELFKHTMDFIEFIRNLQ